MDLNRHFSKENKWSTGTLKDSQYHYHQGNANENHNDITISLFSVSVSKLVTAKGERERGE